MAPLKALKEFSRIVHLQSFSSHQSFVCCRGLGAPHTPGAGMGKELKVVGKKKELVWGSLEPRRP